MAEEKYALLNTLTKNFRKVHIEFDGNGRVQFSYEAMNSAKNGEPAMCTEYVYTSPISTVVKGIKETAAQWNSAWDADFTT